MAERDAATKRKLESLAVLAEAPVESIIGHAVAEHPHAIGPADAHGRKAYEMISSATAAGRSGIATMIMLATTFGYTVGRSLRTGDPGSGEVADHLADVLCRVLRYSIEYGFADGRKEAQNGNASD